MTLFERRDDEYGREGGYGDRHHEEDEEARVGFRLLVMQGETKRKKSGSKAPSTFEHT
jgi:hypothetical protein